MVGLIVKPLTLGDVFENMARVDLKHRPGTKAGQVIIVSANSRTSRLVARGARGKDENCIFLDLATRRTLGLSENATADFAISRGKFFDELFWAWNAPNAGPRVAARLGVLSFGLGVSGLALGIVSIALALRGA
jgi:hypothetical protein